jgi:hypothetical protein
MPLPESTTIFIGRASLASPHDARAVLGTMSMVALRPCRCVVLGLHALAQALDASP